MDNEEQQLLQEDTTEETTEEAFEEIQTGIDEIPERKQDQETDSLILFMELEQQAQQERIETKEQLTSINQQLQANNEKMDYLIQFYENDNSMQLLQEQNSYLSVMSQEQTEVITNDNQALTDFETVQLYGNVSIIVILFLIVIGYLYKYIQSIFSVLTRHIG